MRILNETLQYNDQVIVAVTHFGRRNRSSAVNIYGVTMDPHGVVLSYGTTFVAPSTEGNGYDDRIIVVESLSQIPYAFPAY